MASPKFIVYHSTGDACQSLYMGDDRGAADEIYKTAAAALREDEVREPGSRGGEEIGLFAKPEPDRKVRPPAVVKLTVPEPVEEKEPEKLDPEKDPEKEPEKLDPEKEPEKQEPKPDKPKGKKPAVDEPPGNFKPVE